MLIKIRRISSWSWIFFVETWWIIYDFEKCGAGLLSFPFQFLATGLTIQGWVLAPCFLPFVAWLPSLFLKLTLNTVLDNREIYVDYSEYLTLEKRCFSTQDVDRSQNVALYFSIITAGMIKSIQLFYIFTQVVFWNSSLGTLYNG